MLAVGRSGTGAPPPPGHGGPLFIGLNDGLPLIKAQILDVIDEVKSILKRFKIVNFKQRHQEILDLKTPETGQWFVEKDEIKLWIESRKGVLWVTGGPGAGKTFIACTVVEWMASKTPGDMVVLCVYLDYTEQLSTWDILLGLIFQLIPHIEAIPAIAGLILSTFQRHSIPETKPTLKELTRLLKDILNLIPTVGISIDGLDEMRLEVQTKIIEILADVNACVIFTCRPSTLLEDTVKEYAHTHPLFLHIEAQRHDIELFFSYSIQQTPGFSKLLDKHGLREEIMTIVTDGAGGMFLHAAIQMESLQKCVDPETLRERAKQFPAEIEGLYAETLKRIRSLPRDQAELALQVLAWLVNCSGGLSINDLVVALSLWAELQNEPRREVAEEYLLSVCCGLVILETKTGKIRLVHYTAREALPKLLSDYRPYPHVMIAKTCIEILIRCGFQRPSKEVMRVAADLRKAFVQHPLLKYAHQCLARHLHEGRKSDLSLDDLSLRFVRGCQSFPYIPDIDSDLVWDGAPLILLAPLHVATLLNRPEFISVMLRNDGVDVNVLAGSRPWSSLVVASAEGNIDAFNELLTHHEIQVNPVNAESPLTVACACNRHEIIEQLVTLLGVEDKHQYTLASPALMLAAYNGDEATVALLLKAQNIGIVINHPHLSGYTALHYAASQGHLPVVKLLSAAPRINLNAQGSDYTTPLLVAMHSGHPSVAEYLVAMPGVNIDARDGNQSNPLHLAVVYGYHHLLSTLLAIPGVQPNAQDEIGRTPLMLAAAPAGWDSNHLVALKLLLEVPEVDVNIQDTLGLSALHMAVMHPDPQQAIEALFQRPDINPNIRDNDGCTPLATAAHQGSLAAVQALVKEERVDLNLPANDGYTPLMLAAYHGRTESFHALFAVEGIDTQHRTEIGFSLIGASIHSGIPAIYKPVLELFDSQMPQDDLFQAVFMAAFRGDQSLLRILLNRPDIDINRQDPAGWTSLRGASEGGHEGAVEMLLNVSGVDPNIADHEGWTPLMAAANNGNVGVVERLLKLSGIDVNRVTKAGQSALIWACARGHHPIVQALLSVPGIDTDQQDDEGLSAFMAAALYGHIHILQTLYTHMTTPSKPGAPVPKGISCKTKTGETVLVLTMSEFHSYELPNPDPRARNAKPFFPEEVIHLLLDYPEIQALANQADDAGRTPLIHACRAGRVRLVSRLLQISGVDPSVVDSQGKSVLAYAWEAGVWAEHLVTLLKGKVDDSGSRRSPTQSVDMLLTSIRSVPYPSPVPDPSHRTASPPQLPSSQASTSSKRSLTGSLKSFSKTLKFNIFKRKKQ